jgi:hypothetical protein
MSTTAEATAPAARLTQRQMTLRLARLIRKGLPGPTNMRVRTLFAINADLAAKGHTSARVERPSVHLWFATDTDLRDWATDLDFRTDDKAIEQDGNVHRSTTAVGTYEGWFVYLHFYPLITAMPPVILPLSHGRRRRARAAISGRLV